MPRSSHGKWVARVGATGGGRTYRGQVPVNWYAALILIVILGVASVVYARYEYTKGTVVNTIPPIKGGLPWFAGLDFDICGTARPPLPSNAVDTSTQSFFALGDGVIEISPKTTADAGTNAVFGKFVSGYQGLKVTSTQIGLPAQLTSTVPSASSTTPSSPTTSPGKKTTKPGTKTTKPGSKRRDANATAVPRAEAFHNGEKCPAGTKDAGKRATVRVGYWKSAFTKSSRPTIVTGDPATLRFTNDQLITVGFLPDGAKLPKPAGSIVSALLSATSGQTAPPTTPTSAPGTTTPTSTPATTTPTSTPATTTPTTTPATTTPTTTPKS